MNPFTPISNLNMVGPAYARRLQKLNIRTAEDLLYHFPFRYLDYSVITPIAQVKPGQIVTVQGTILTFQNEYTLRGKQIQKSRISDQSGIIEAVWFNQPFLARIFKPETSVSLSGKVDFWGRKLALVSPEYENINDPGWGHGLPQKPTIHTGRLVPVYHETYGVSSKWLRSRIAPLLKAVLWEIKDFLPLIIKTDYRLLDLASALKQIHFPQNRQEIEKARNRLAFDELFLAQLSALCKKYLWQKKQLAHQLSFDRHKIHRFVSSLPFKLTTAQLRALKEIAADLKKTKPMNRLLEGDVGSGKTVVAAAAVYLAAQNQVQSALMAPTEILAHQHYQTLQKILSPFDIKIALLTGGTRKIQSDFDLIIGTHALIHKRASFAKLGLAVIDEQHRFGVQQRSSLIKKGRAPHVLTMTATPIPRTIALTLYGDLDLSVIDEMPPGRRPVKTWLVPSEKRASAYQWIRRQVKNTPDQAFVICPLIEKSDHETLRSVKAAATEFNRLKKDVFPDLKLGLLHGRLKSPAKQTILAKFKTGRLDILVSTPVIEVGIDIPGATIMIIEAAERFGLAQLHQLRGRVGRGEKQAYCLLFTELQSRKTSRRLKALEKSNLGIKLAEIDLKLRGPGEMYGTRQHGFTEFKIASLADVDLIQKTKKAAEIIFLKDPEIRLFPLLHTKLKQVKINNVDPN